MFLSKTVSAIKSETIKNYEKGYVLIQDKKVVLKPDVYTKRQKIFNDKGLWVDTLPLMYNNVITSIVPK